MKVEINIYAFLHLTWYTNYHFVQETLRSLATSLAEKDIKFWLWEEQPENVATCLASKVRFCFFVVKPSCFEHVRLVSS
jgi:deoxyribodipyrimidine photolyase